MKLIQWGEFTKDELVQLLKFFEQYSLPVEQLMLGEDATYPRRCSCPSAEERLPEAILQLRTRALERSKRLVRPTIFGRLLRRPGVRDHAKKSVGQAHALQGALRLV